MTLGELKKKFNLKTEKQALFCMEYVIDLNGTQATIRAGYSPKTAFVQASRLLSYANVQACVQHLKDERGKKTGVSQEFVVNGLKATFARCMQVTPVLDKDGVPIGNYNFNASGANRALELLGKHLGMFIDKIEHSDAPKKPIDLSELTEAQLDEVLESGQLKFN
ncbi:MAG: terminase [Parcubacteria group bacterium]|jgi:phage terminase small subunit|nr:terminase [Parcubacteria group bacterium]|tara:strand:+ start:15766 stop:16260 length:495 start_codon:yes stop_codon:yes gene_type:complete